MASIGLLEPTSTTMATWVRRASERVNFLLRRVDQPFVFQNADAEPVDPVPGQAYFDTVTDKLRVWDGTTWQNAW